MRRFRIVVAVLAAVVSLSGATSVSAHTTSAENPNGPRYHGLWRTNGVAGKDVVFRFTTSVAADGRRDRIANGFGNWNATPGGTSLTYFRYSGTDLANFDPAKPCDQPDNRNGIHWLPMGVVGRAGRTYTCLTSTTILNAQIVFDSDGSTQWYLGTSTPTCTALICLTDLISVAAHEVGHFGGHLYGGPVPDEPGHWDENSGALCAESGSTYYGARETMCPTIYEGTTMMRTPSTHDNHTRDYFY